ncbi:MGH1-like glycoside hydrolase domain-containing protein [Flavihumibacter solisilvae]|uniref:Glucosidase n=1 Tax=Flavihumibacter solisilvae TaxID=1349421 RepID=A0A0C1KZI2_9BACT|nr:glucosidase [Flavihumibacter solisilvae]KIC93117.1 glucosidase [Flavihumibacter solisilvae]
METVNYPLHNEAESQRMIADRDKISFWKNWGPYLSERQWGTVREDYSKNGDAWNYFTHDQARSRTYRWGEDGIAGISDNRQNLCFAVAMWNGNDPIIKERLFGLTNSEGNHGEDVKEYYYYLDCTPTHSYMKYLYKYPQSAYPYDDIVATNRKRTRNEFEYELIDTGVFDDDRYFDVFVEYAKASPDDILVKISVHNRGDQPAILCLLPTLWFRNNWSHHEDNEKPELTRVANKTTTIIRATHSEASDMFLYCEGKPSLLFTDNETNTERIFGTPNTNPYVKDGINNFIVHDKLDAVNPAGTGTKAAACYWLIVQPGNSESVRLRISACDLHTPFDDDFENAIAQRKFEADEFFDSKIPASLSADEKNIMRQAIAGMLWSKQFYLYDITVWLNGRDETVSRNFEWQHMSNSDIISMPDKWEYPWYASWDIAFHVLALTLVDSDFGKQQLSLMLAGHYMHPNGQVPAYEWNFGDVNPPVLAWATIYTYRLENMIHHIDDIHWLRNNFHKLELNFSWWINRRDRSGHNVFEGGFLGLDNIGVFDRSAPLPTGGCLEQADSTAWMALFSQNMLEIAIELAIRDKDYITSTIKYVEHFLRIAASMVDPGESCMWDEEDGFFYDVLQLPDGTAQRLKVRSFVGLLPLCAVCTYDGVLTRKYPELGAELKRLLHSHADLQERIHDCLEPGVGGRKMAGILNETNLRRVLGKLLDENEFLGPYGIRSLSRYHLEHPYTIRVKDQDYSVAYTPGESDSGMFGGNSNWRGPIWMPVNALVIRALLQYYMYYGDDFKVECPTGSGNYLTFYQVAEHIADRLSKIFTKDENGHRALFGGAQKFQEDPNWRDYILFYEYYQAENGAGLGASHQTGWSGTIARSLQLFSHDMSAQLLAEGVKGMFVQPDPLLV